MVTTNDIEKNIPLAEVSCFTIPYYIQIIKKLEEAGFTFSLFKSSLQADRKVYMRHDVDLSIDRALFLARIEAQQRVTASYFLMIDTELYNVGSSNEQDKISEIIDLGHDIGLHFVPKPNMDKLALEEQLVKEGDILGKLINHPILAFSIHRPADGVISADLSPTGMVNAYAPAYFSKLKYISDSNHHFRCGDPLQFIQNFEGYTLQILTHPVWWSSEDLTPEKKIYDLIEDYDLRAKSYLCKNVTFAREVLG